MNTPQQKLDCMSVFTANFLQFYVVTIYVHFLFNWFVDNIYANTVYELVVHLSVLFYSAIGYIVTICSSYSNQSLFFDTA